MANRSRLKMLLIFLFGFSMVNEVISATIGLKNKNPCDCYEACTEKFKSNYFGDVQKIAACQRGCRFYMLVLHTSHERNLAGDSANARVGCHFSCSESYKVPIKVSACNFGCSAVEASRTLCNSLEKQIPQFRYYVLIEESDVLIHPGEPDLDEVITDPGLRKQFGKTLEVLRDQKSKLPEIHFRNLPVRNEKSPAEYPRINFKCPKFYGFDSKLEFRNGKIIIGDLYLFVGVFLFVVICFLLGHHIEARNMAKQLAKKKEESEGREALLKADSVALSREAPPGYAQGKWQPAEGGPETKFEVVAMPPVFRGDPGSEVAPAEGNALEV